MGAGRFRFHSNRKRMSGWKSAILIKFLIIPSARGGGGRIRGDGEPTEQNVFGLRKIFSSRYFIRFLVSEQTNGGGCRRGSDKGGRGAVIEIDSLIR